MHAQDPDNERLTTGQLDTVQERLATLERMLASQHERIALQDEEIQRLRAELAGSHAEPEAGGELILPASAKRTTGRKATSRRSLLKFGGMAAAASAAAVAASVVTSKSAHATGVAWQTGTVLADTETLVKPSSSGYPSADILQLQVGTGTPYYPLGGTGPNLKAALAAYDTTTNNIGVYGTSSTGYGLFGVTNTGTGAQGAGLNGTATSSGTGVAGSSQSGIGVQGNSNSGLGASFVGGLAPLALGLSFAAGAPSSGAHTPGEIYLDSTATLFVCVSGGAPGTWARVGVVSPGSVGGTVNFLSAPIRLLDARSGATSGLVNRGALSANETYPLLVAGLGGSGIPAGALGLICNVTVLGPSGNGNLSLFPTGAPIPTTASMTFVAGAFLANHVTSALGSGGGNQGKVNIQNQSGGNTPLVVDAVGFIL